MDAVLLGLLGWLPKLLVAIALFKAAKWAASKVKAFLS